MIANEVYFLSAHKVHTSFQSNCYTDFYTYEIIVLGDI